jgi:hypothetical protein
MRDIQFARCLQQTPIPLDEKKGSPIHYDEARRRFHGDRFENLYQAWSNGTITERELRLEFSQLKPDRPVFFGTFLVHEHRSPVAEILRRGDGCVKDTRNPPRHRSRHPRGDAKLEDLLLCEVLENACRSLLRQRRLLHDGLGIGEL